MENSKEPTVPPSPAVCSTKDEEEARQIGRGEKATSAMWNDHIYDFLVIGDGESKLFRKYKQT